MRHNNTLNSRSGLDLSTGTHVEPHVHAAVRAGRRVEDDDGGASLRSELGANVEDPNRISAVLCIKVQRVGECHGGLRDIHPGEQGETADILRQGIVGHAIGAIRDRQRKISNSFCSNATRIVHIQSSMHHYGGLEPGQRGAGGQAQVAVDHGVARVGDCGCR